VYVYTLYIGLCIVAFVVVLLFVIIDPFTLATLYLILTLDILYALETIYFKLRDHWAVRREFKEEEFFYPEDTRERDSVPYQLQARVEEEKLDGEIAPLLDL
jgi:hypothetical protein